MIDRNKWIIGQANERRHHLMGYEEGYEHYKNAYGHYFRYLNIEPNLTEKSIIEVGSADFPALGYCTNYSNSYVIEPMPSKILQKICKEKGLTLIAEPAEEVDFPKVDEVWFLNVLQHVLDPDIIINKAKEAAQVIRFFEPVEAGRDSMHHWEFTMDYFRERFGDCVTYYPPNQGIKGFHTWQNCYGVFTK